MKILINTEITSDHRQQIQSVSPDLVIVEPKDEAARLAEMPDTDVLFGDFNRSLFNAADQLKWVQVLGAGVDGLLFPEFVESDIILLSAKGYVGPHLADQDVGVNPRFDTRRRPRRARAHMGKPLEHPRRDLGTGWSNPRNRGSGRYRYRCGETRARV